MFFKSIRTIQILIFLFIFSFNATSQNRQGVESAMRQYDHLILSMDVDSIALLYTPDGDLGNIAHGRDSIRNFLYRFKNFKVLSQISKTDSISIYNDTAIQKGTYQQKTVISANDTVSVKGLFTAKWIFLNGSG